MKRIGVARRGFTLVEMMVAVALLTAVMAVAVSVIGAGVRVSRQSEQTFTSNDAARVASEVLLRDLRLSGAMQGVFVADVGAGTMHLTNPIFTEAGPNGTDALWVVAPRPNSMQTDCTKVGSAVVVTVASGSGPLAVNCTAPLVGATHLLVTNFKRAAIITPSALAAQSIDFDEMAVTNFGPAPEKGGMQRGDMVVPVQLVRFSIAPAGGGVTTRLMRQIGQVNPAFTTAQPFTVAVGARTERYDDIEDLQVAWGTGVAPNITFASGHNAPFNAAAVPVALRLNLVGLGRLANRDDNGNLMALSPLTLEDHVPSPAVDGFRRSLFRRRVELLNNGALNL